MNRRFILAAASCLELMAALCSAAEADRLVIPATKPSIDTKTGPQKLKGALLYVPSSYRPADPMPLLILLHGLDMSPGGWLSSGQRRFGGSFADHAEAGRFIVLAPDSGRNTFGIGPATFGSDVAAINRALDQAFAKCAIDRHRIAIGGLSDGASYALSVGLRNGDLINGIIAFSPGYIVKHIGRARPAIFISHGRADTILPIDSASRKFVKDLRKNGYTVDYEEFDGRHEIPLPVAKKAVAWLTANFQKTR